MWTCPVPGCYKKCRNAGAKQHMTKMHPDWVFVSGNGDNLLYRAPTETPEEVAKSVPVRTLKKPTKSVPYRELKLPIITSAQPPVEKKEVSRRIVLPKKKKPKTDLKAIITKMKERTPKKKDRSQDFDPNWDPEPTLEIVTKIPLFIIMGIVAYKYFTNPEFFMQFLDNDLIEVYKFVFSDISSPGSIIILALTAIVLFLLIFLIYKMFWRFMFKDLQIRKGFSPDSDKYRKGPGTSFEGRIYLTIGDGFWDRIYRRYTKRPKPKVMTIFFRRSFRDPSILNPFKVLASCHRGYIVNTDGSRFIRDGLFKRTLIATHMRRDTENESIVYWFEDELYKSKPFTADWYRDRHKGVIKESLAKVSKACLMDSTTQKDQMKNVISWLPSSEIEEQERVWMMKEEAKKLEPELELEE